MNDQATIDTYRAFVQDFEDRLYFRCWKHIEKEPHLFYGENLDEIYANSKAELSQAMPVEREAKSSQQG